MIRPNLPRIPRVQLRDAQILRRYDAIRKESGILKIAGQTIESEIEDLEIIEMLGSGSFGEVFKVRHRKTGIIMAVKKIKMGNDLEDKKAVTDVKVVMKSQDCPFIVRCYGFFIFDYEVCICMERMLMCLQKLLKIARKFPEGIVGKIAKPVIEALLYLKEKQRMMHRDIKPSNVLIDVHGGIKVCDFGIAGRLIDTNRAESYTLGSILYLAPERIEAQHSYGVAADVWSLGITLLELATGTNPYNKHAAQRDAQLVKNQSITPDMAFLVLSVIKNEDPPSVRQSDGLSEQFSTFISKCLQREPELRSSFAQLLEEPFITENERDKRLSIERWLHSVNTTARKRNVAELQNSRPDGPVKENAVESEGFDKTVTRRGSKELKLGRY